MSPVLEYVDGTIPAIPLVSIVMIAIAGLVWLFYMRKIGGSAGLFFSLTFTAMCLAAICELHYITVITIEEIRFWGIATLACLITACLSLFLGGEYSMSDQPISWRIMVVGGFAGFIYGALLLSTIPEYGVGLIYAVDLRESGWIWQASPLFGGFLALFLIGSIGAFIRFCAILYRAEMNSPFRFPSRKFIISLAIGLPAIIGLSIMRLFYASLDLEPSIIQLCSILVIFIIIIALLSKESRVIYLQPYKPIALILVDTAGSVHFTRHFNTNKTMAFIELFAPAITAINSIVQQSLKLNPSEWIQEFSTDEHMFLLQVNSKIEMIGVLLVTKPTQMVRKALAKFMSRLDSIWKKSYEHEVIPSDQEEFNQLITDAFPLVVPRRKKTPRT